MNSEHQRALQADIARLAHSYDKPDGLFAAVRKEHPEASKKDIVLAAFAEMIESVEKDAGKARKLHTMALAKRAG